jgi:two-component system, NtrC family, response regulator AtoC
VGDSAKPHILLIEDEKTQRSLLEEVLALSDYTYESAGGCEEGRELFARGRFSCALIDLGLPDGSGLNLLGEFTREDPSLVAIVLTGDASAETVIDTLREGAFDYLTKPVNITTLRAAMARALSHHAVVRERAELFRLLLEERE